MTRRRDLIKLGLLSTGSALYHAEVLRGDDNLAKSPPTIPFISPMPISPALPQLTALSPAPTLAANTAQGEAQRPNHQRFNEFLPQVFFDVHCAETPHVYYQGFPPSPSWTLNGFTPGPTIFGRYGIPALLRLHNDLPANHVGFGSPQCTMHLHNAHTASESDGFPGDFFNSGLFKDNHYPNIYAGGDSNEALGTLWYHDHRVDFTAPNAYKGIAGFCILYDFLDSGNEKDPNPNALRLPSGDFDVPLAFADKAFDANGLLTFDQFNTDGFLGDKFTVNGVIQPFFEVHKRKYRFRLLDLPPSRFYQFFLSTGQPFVQISSDGNLLPNPITRTSILISPAERIDVIIDFSKYKIGDHIFLQNRLVQTDGRGPKGDLVSPGDSILRFDVIGPDNFDDPSQVPTPRTDRATLRPLPQIDTSKAATTRKWEFVRRQGAWQVNDHFFDLNRIDANPKQNTSEIWTLKNGGGGWTHPIHIHLEEFRILSRNGKPPVDYEAGRKDMVRLGPDDEVTLFIQFRDWLGQYPIHCHNTVHEDHAMMARWVVSA